MSSKQPFKIFYNPELDVIEIDLTNVNFTAQVAEEGVTAIVDLAKSLPHKTYLLACWNGARMTPEGKDYYVAHIHEILEVVKKIVRYDVTEFITKVGLKVSTMSSETPSEIYKDRASAIEAIRSWKTGSK